LQYFHHRINLTSSSASFLSNLQRRNTDDLIYQLDKANKSENGSAFLAIVQTFNKVMKELKESGVMRSNIEQMPGVHEKLWTLVTTDSYTSALY